MGTYSTMACRSCCRSSFESCSTSPRIWATACVMSSPYRDRKNCASAGVRTREPVNSVGRDSVEPRLDLLGKSHGSTESRPTVLGGEVEPHFRTSGRARGLKNYGQRRAHSLTRPNDKLPRSRGCRNWSTSPAVFGVSFAERICPLGNGKIGKSRQARR